MNPPLRRVAPVAARCLFVACIALLLFGGGANAGTYQLTNDGRTYVWNNNLLPGDTASWSGQMDSQGYATGYGTLTWYKRGVWASRYSGTMVSGKLNGAVANEDADGRKFRGTYVDGKKSTDWAEVSNIADTQRPAPPSVSKAENIELVAAKSAGYVDYAWAGMGDSGTMMVRVVNKTEREWIVEIEVGTKLEPSSGDVQSMVVTKEIQAHLEPHESNKLEVQMACLDISKPPPDTADVNWTVQVSSRLAAFVACVNRLLDAVAAEASGDQQEHVRRMRPHILQIAVWKARGATKDQWIDFFVHYQNMTPDEAREKASAVEQISSGIVQECPSL